LISFLFKYFGFEFIKAQIESVGYVDKYRHDKLIIKAQIESVPTA